MSFSNREDLDDLLRAIDAAKSSDLHLGPGRVPMMRWNGKLVPVPGYLQVITNHDMEIILEAAYRSPTGPSAVMSMEDLDFSYELANTIMVNTGEPPARYRVNASGSMLGIRMVFRRLPASPPSLDKLNVPKECTELIRSMDKGLVLVTGPTGSGKTTTLAGWLRDLLESNRSLHIITLENPIEFRYDDLNLDAAWITQRELRKSMLDFKTAMKSVLRQDPDIVMVGEMRDIDTIRLAMEVADTGHLVLSTTHTSDVPSTISRIVQLYSPEEQQSARTGLLSSLRMIVCQLLLPTVSGGRCAAREYLIFTPEMRRELMMLDPENLQFKLHDLTRSVGVPMSKSIQELYESGTISAEIYAEKLAALQEEAGVVMEADAKAREEAKMSSVELAARRKALQEKIRAQKTEPESMADRFVEPVKKVKKKTIEKEAPPAPVIHDASPSNEVFTGEVLESKDNIKYVSPAQNSPEEQGMPGDGSLLDLAADEAPIDFQNPVLETFEGGKRVEFTQGQADETKPVNLITESVKAQEPDREHDQNPTQQEKTHVDNSPITTTKTIKAMTLDDPNRYWAPDEEPSGDWEKWQNVGGKEIDPLTTPIKITPDDAINLEGIAWAMNISVDEIEKKIRENGLESIRDTKALQDALTQIGKSKKRSK